MEIRSIGYQYGSSPIGCDSMTRNSFAISGLFRSNLENRSVFYGGLTIAITGLRQLRLPIVILQSPGASQLLGGSCSDAFRLLSGLFFLAQIGHQVPKNTLLGLAFHW